jgi:hypothetical protein
MKRILFMVLSIIMLSALLASCGGKVTTPPVTTAIPVTSVPPTATTTPAPTTTTGAVPTTTAADTNENFIYASAMADFFTNLNSVENYYSDGVGAMATFTPGSGALPVTAGSRPRVILAGFTINFNDHSSQIPKEFSDKLPAGGNMPAPAGACPAAADPTSKFLNKDGEVITPELLEEKQVITIPTDLINAPQTDADSLNALMKTLVPMNDMRLGTAAGWNDLLWDQLKAYQEPAGSLMDYQMWTLTDDIEREIVSGFRQSLVDAGVPQRVLDAFDQSDTTGWFGQTQPEAGDALALMDIKAVLTGSISGTVHEWRDFSIPELGADPVYGVQKGDGTVTFTQPEIGKFDSTVDINLDQFDEMGRAIGGTVVAIPIGHDEFKIVFTFKPDGSKEGQIIDQQTGEILGYLTMTVDHAKFENYVDIKEGTTLKLPDDPKTIFQ